MVLNLLCVNRGGCNDGLVNLCNIFYLKKKTDGIGLRRVFFVLFPLPFCQVNKCCEYLEGAPQNNTLHRTILAPHGLPFPFLHKVTWQCVLMYHDFPSFSLSYNGNTFTAGCNVMERSTWVRVKTFKCAICKCFI